MNRISPVSFIKLNIYIIYLLLYYKTKHNIRSLKSRMLKTKRSKNSILSVSIHKMRNIGNILELHGEWKEWNLNEECIFKVQISHIPLLVSPLPNRKSWEIFIVYFENLMKNKDFRIPSPLHFILVNKRKKSFYDENLDPQISIKKWNIYHYYYYIICIAY